jgi:hypothetical protein
VPVQPAFLDEGVQGLPNGGATDPELRAQLVLGGDPLALPSQILPNGIGDLKVPRNTLTIVHLDLLLSECPDSQLSSGAGGVNQKTRGRI